MAGVAVHERKRRIQIDFHTDFFRSEAEALEIHSALHNLVQGHQAALRNCFPGVQEQLAENGVGALRFLINLAHLFGPPGQILAPQNAVRVAENAGQRIAQFMRDSAHHLSERGELFGLQEFRMENALGGQVAVDLHAPQKAADGIEHRPRRSLENAWRRKIHLQLFAQTTFDSARKFPPLLRE